MSEETREATELTTLARARFPDLRKSELKFLDAVTRGKIAGFGPSFDEKDPSNDPASAAPWGIDREIRAGLIRWLCVDREAAKWIDPRGLRIYAARISGELDLSFTTVKFPLLLVRCRIAEEMNLRDAQVEFLELSGSFLSGLVGDGIRVRGDLNLSEGFRSDGEVRLLGADIGGNLDCGKGKFMNPGRTALSADRMKVAGTVSLSNGFSADGEVRLAGAEIGVDFSCVGGKFVNSGGMALVADGVKVTGSVFLGDGFSAEGEVRLLEAEIGGVFAVSRAEFAADSVVNAQGATVKGVFFWRGLEATVKPVLNLSHASVGPMGDDPESWPASGNLYLDGFEYARFGGGPTDAKSRLEWLRRHPPDEFIPQPYRQLAKVLREAGDNVGARRVLVAMENARHERGKLTSFAQAWHRILGATMGYDYRPWLALRWGAGIVAFGCLLFGLGYCNGAMTPTDAGAYKVFETYFPKERHGNPPWYYEKFSAPIYSLGTFLPIINFGEKDRWMPNPHYGFKMTSGGLNFGGFLRFWLWIQMAAGWILTTLFVAGFTSAVRKE